MQYVDLKKLYYSDREAYKKEYESRFNNSDTVKLNFYIGDNQAFFVPNAEAYSIALNILKSDKKIFALTKKLPNAAINQYFNKCLIDETVVTNKIEGVHSSRKEIGDVLDVLKTQSKGKKSLRFIGLVKKYAILNSHEKIEIKTCEDVRKIYDELLLSEVKQEDLSNIPDGKIFRKSATSIYNESGKEIHMGFYPESKIIDGMESALKILSDESIESIFRICIFHYMIEYIHPFYDGNGRIGRFILSYCISKNLEPLLAFRISKVIKENIKEYYKAFELCNDYRNLGDLTPFLIMMLNMIYEAQEDLYSALEHRLISLTNYRDYIPKLKNSEKEDVKNIYYILIQASLFSEKGVSSTELKDAAKIKTYSTLNRKIEMLDERLLVIRRYEKTNYYELNLKALDKMMFEE